MFEGWLADLLAGYLGHFLDVKREQLRLSLWSGVTWQCSTTYKKHASIVANHAWLFAVWSTGFVLENVALKLEAFDYLQLPFAVSEGCIGQLKVQVSS